ncbi:MAG TPA: DUF4127 family protein [Anaerolineaceae bacterium]|nr:DUF4127 family protein [Anaerolineaceae bacterium]
MRPFLALLPLDDRPASLVFPRQIAQIAGLDLLLPPRTTLGHFKKPGNPALAGEWLQKAADHSMALLVSTEMLVYGGLYASRYPQISLKTALQNLSTLEEIHRKHPDLPILAAGLIMRHTVSAAGAGSARVYEALMRYTELKDLVEIQGKFEYNQELSTIRNSIPPEVIFDYHEARLRNHQVNLRLLEYLAGGALQGLILLQDDSRPAGLHRLEQQALLEQGTRLGIADRFHICPGGDEGALDLLALWLNSKQPLQCELRFTSLEGAQQIADYEDRPIHETVTGHFHAANVVKVQQNAGLVFWVHTPSSILEVERAAAEITHLIHAGKLVALADVRFPNGSDPSLLERLCASGLIPHLAAYAGWNTAGNSIGAAIAQASAWWTAVSHVPTQQQLQAQLLFLWQRIVDDWGYQRVIRQPLEARSIQEGKDVLDLGSSAPEVRKEIEILLTRWSNQTWRGGQWKGIPPTLSISLPWGRTFEIELKLKKNQRYEDWFQTGNI